MPVEAHVIEEQIKSLGEFRIFGTKKEIAELHNIIAEGEIILGLGSGMIDGNTWLCTVTDRRVLLLNKGMFYGLKQLEMPIANIKSVTHKTGLASGELLIDTGGDTKTIKSIVNADVQRLAALISGLVHDKGIPKPLATQPLASGDDVLAKLERLAVLMEKGLLTDDEFAEAKRKILGGE